MLHNFTVRSILPVASPPPDRTSTLSVSCFTKLVAGDLCRPVTGDWARDTWDALLREDLQSCPAGRPAERFAGAG